MAIGGGAAEAAAARAIARLIELLSADGRTDGRTDEHVAGWTSASTDGDTFCAHHHASSRFCDAAGKNAQCRTAATEHDEIHHLSHFTQNFCRCQATT